MCCKIVMRQLINYKVALQSVNYSIPAGCSVSNTYSHDELYLGLIKITQFIKEREKRITKAKRSKRYEPKASYSKRVVPIGFATTPATGATCLKHTSNLKEFRT